MLFPEEALAVTESRKISELPTPPEIKTQLERIIRENRQLEFLGRDVPKGDERAIAFLQARKALVLLYLRTPITDSSVTSIIQMETLEYANAVDTEITDEGGDKLLASHIKKVYFWRDVTR